MRLVVAGSLVAATLACLPAHAIGPGRIDMTWRTSDDGDGELDSYVVDPLVDSLAETGATTSRCVPATGVVRHATITYFDTTGRPTFEWHHDITYSYNCKAVTRLATRAGGWCSSSRRTRSRVTS
jgi:hypothetical protein